MLLRWKSVEEIPEQDGPPGKSRMCLFAQENIILPMIGFYDFEESKWTYSAEVRGSEPTHWARLPAERRIYENAVQLTVYENQDSVFFDNDANPKPPPSSKLSFAQTLGFALSDAASRRLNGMPPRDAEDVG